MRLKMTLYRYEKIIYGKILEMSLIQRFNSKYDFYIYPNTEICGFDGSSGLYACNGGLVTEKFRSILAAHEFAYKVKKSVEEINGCKIKIPSTNKIIGGDKLKLQIIKNKEHTFIVPLISNFEDTDIDGFLFRKSGGFTTCSEDELKISIGDCDRIDVPEQDAFLIKLENVVNKLNGISTKEIPSFERYL